MVLWLLPLVELFQKEKHKLAVRDTFCMISPRLFGVRKSSWVFWAAMIVLSIVLPSTVHWRAIDARFIRGQNFHFFKKWKNFIDFFENRYKNFWNIFSKICLGDFPLGWLSPWNERFRALCRPGSQMPTHSKIVILVKMMIFFEKSESVPGTQSGFWFPGSWFFIAYSWPGEP